MALKLVTRPTLTPPVPSLMIGAPQPSRARYGFAGSGYSRHGRSLAGRARQFAGVFDNVTFDDNSLANGLDWFASQPQPSASDFTFPANATFPAGSAPSLSTLIPSIVKGGKDYFGAEAALNTAKAQADLAKAQGQAAVAVAKAGGRNAAQTAGAGLPSPTLLLVGGLALAAVMLLKN